MNNSDRYLLSVQFVHDAHIEICGAVISMAHKDVWVVIRHLATAKAYLNAAKSWWEYADCDEPLTRRLDEVIEAVHEKQWAKAWRLCWDLVRPLEFLQSYQPEEDTTIDE